MSSQLWTRERLDLAAPRTMPDCSKVLGANEAKDGGLGV